MMQQLLVITQKIVSFSNISDIFELEERVECLCKVFSVCTPSSKGFVPFKIFQECPNLNSQLKMLSTMDD